MFWKDSITLRTLSYGSQTEISILNDGVTFTKLINNFNVI